MKVGGWWLVGLLLAAPLQAQDWLLGAWPLCHDPEGGRREVLEFKANGFGTVQQVDGRLLPFSWQLQNGQVALQLYRQGHATAWRLDPSPDQRRLLLRNPRTGAVSDYVRQRNESISSCSAR